jgi:chromosome segregation ATPase
MPADFPAGLSAVQSRIEAKPDQSATVEAQTFLTTAQLRLNDYRDALRKNEAAKLAADAAKAAYNSYCRAMEDELNALYDDVQEDFSTFYRLINGDDEAKFTAKLTPSEGRLDFSM